MENFRSALQAASALHGEEAEAALRRLLAAYPNLDPEDEGSARHALGLALFRQNKNLEALQELERACELFSLRPGPALALAKTALARVEIARGNVQKSVITGREARDLLERHLPEDDRRLAPSLFALSFVEYEAHNLARAEALSLRAKALWEKERGPESLEVSTCLNNLGRIYEETGRPEEGIALHRAALAIRRKILGEHQETAFSMGNLGTALAAAGHWREAADVLQEALECYARCGRTTGESIEGYRRNLEICKAALAEEGAR